MWDTGTEAWSMGVETNPIVARLDTGVVAFKEERTVMKEYWKRQTEMHYGYHAHLRSLSCHEGESGCQSDGCSVERCRERVVAMWCARQYESPCLSF